MNLKKKRQNKFFNIAIDGPAGAGKSSISFLVSKRLKILHLDTGALYRALAYHLTNCPNFYEVNFNLEEKLKGCNIEVEFCEGVQKIFVNEIRVDEFIRTEKIANAASLISKNICVRKFLLNLQRDFAAKNNLIMDGRDIGTVVLPNADLKIFLTASLNVRALRRFKELKLKGVSVCFSDVLKDVKERDLNDVKRKISPLKAAKDAVILDTTNLTVEESVSSIIKLAEKFVLGEHVWVFIDLLKVV